MILYLPLCLVSFPPNINLLYKILLPLSTLDMIPPEISTDLIFNFSHDEDQAYNDRLSEMGFDNHNAIENIGSIIYILALYCMLTLVALGLITLKLKNKFCCRSKLKLHLPFIPLLRGLYIIMFEEYLIIMISCFLSIKGAVRINIDDKISYKLSQVLPIIIFTVFPITLINVLFKPIKRL